MSRSPRPLAAIRRLLTVLFVLDVLGLLITLLNVIGGGTDAQMTVFAGSDPALSAAGLHATSVNAWIVEPSTWQSVLGILSSSSVSLLVALPMLIAARRLIDLATDSQPFTAEVTSGLRRLGIVVLVLGAAGEVIRTVAGYLAFTSAVPDSAGLRYQWQTPTFWWLLVGLTVLGFAQIVEHGRKLRAELDEVI